MMQKRGWQNLPEQARRQMDAYTVNKKWTLVHQDRLSELQNNQHRIQSQRNTMNYDNRGQTGLLERSNEVNSPEWYVRKVMDNSITPNQLSSLIVELRTQPIQWVMTFVNAQGQIALSNVLNKLNRRQGQGSAQVTAADLDREYDIVKCLRTSLSNDFGKDDALDHPQIIVNLAACLTSTRLPTRKLVSENLTYLCHGTDGAGHLRVLQAMDQLKAANGENGRFDAWMRIVEVTVDGRGKMGSMVGASEEYRTGGVGVENLLMEYAVSTLMFVNMIVDAPERDLQLRCHLRAQLNGCGIQRIFTKMEGFQYEVIDKQIEKFRTNESIDYEDLLERDGSSNQDGEGDETIRDLNDPQQITEAISSKLQGTKEQDYFLSTMQHMLLIRDNQGEDRTRMFQLVDSMLSYVAMDRRLPDMDLKQSLNFTVQGLLDKLYTDSEARQAREEALESRQIADAAIAERDDVRAQVELGAGGLVAKLQKQLEEQQAVINLQNRKLDGVKAELSESQRLRAQDLQRNELETRELYLMLRDAQDATAAAAKKDGKVIKDPIQMQGILDREKLMDRLEMTLERQKTQAKLEGKVWQMVNPSDELRDLREQMDDGEARPLSHLAAEVRAPSRQFGSTTRKSKMPPSEPTEEITEIEDESVVFEKPRLVEFTKPKLDKTAAKGYLNDIMAKVRRVGDSDDEDADGDGVTTGPSHPSIDSPKTPEEPTAVPSSPTKGTMAPPPAPPPPPMPGFNNIAPPPAPPLPPLMPGFSGAPAPPPPPMPGFFSGGPPPPPAPPMPGFSGGPPPPPPPSSMPGFTDGPPPPPPPPPGTSGHWAFVNGNAPPPAPPVPGAPPLPGAMTPYRTGLQNSYHPAPSTNYGVRPKKKLKALHWEKLDTPQVTMWATHTPTHEAKESKYLELSKNGILDEVERLFMAKEIKAIGKSAKKIGDKKQIISSDLMRNFHIALNKFSSTSVEDIVRMIIHCDAAVLENVVVMDFLQRSDLCDIPDNTAKLMAPYAADYKTGTAADRDQDPAELTREDQLYLHTAFELHHYWKSRMRALALTRTYEKDFDDLSVRLKQVVTVSDSLRDSVSLMNVLGLILDIGNYMNDTSKQATGFKLSTLARLGMVKDEKNESTFADIIERIVRVQYPQWESFTSEIAGVIPAQKINVEQLRQDARKYIDNIANVQMSLDSGNLSDPKRFHPQDRVSQVVQRAMKDARWKASQLQLFLDDMSKTYEEILVFYGEDASDENARRDFFAKLAIFLMEWRKSKEKNLALEDQKRKMEESMRRKQGVGLMGPPKTAASQLVNGDGDAPTPPGGAMDSLLEKLRAAAPQVKDQRDRRRRARLKDRHQVRVASGQAMPDLPGSPPEESSRENGLLSPPGEIVDASSTSLTASSVETGSLANGKDDSSADVDIADRAALMLQGLGDGIATPSADTLSMRRRRESSDIERERRRNRRKVAGTGASEISEAIPEEPRSPVVASAGIEVNEAAVDSSSPQKRLSKEGGDVGLEIVAAGLSTPPETNTDTSVPTTVVVPPSPRQP